MEDQANKPHRKAKAKAKHASGQPNPRAFAFAKPGKLSRTAARSNDIKEKRLHVPLIDRLPDEPPPKLVAIVGPPGVGKTTLLRSLIRRYAKETISHPVGPVTIVTSKKQRLCFVECPNNLESMVDIAHVADIVLLLIDGNYGFEMETMEFLNILAATGMPGNVMGVLTHLDLFTKPYALRDAKKRLKHRLWNELYKGAHLFYLSGVINGRYPDREVFNLSRYLSVMKNPRPLVFRNSHAYAVVDNYRDITHPTKIEEDAKCDRIAELSGYLRGTNFAAQGQRVHVPGLGDFTVASIEVLPDPCPTPAMQAAEAKVTGKTGRRRLDEKDKKLHAPMSDRSGLKIVGDHVYITREKGFTFDKDAEDVERGEGEQLIIDLQAERRLLGQSQTGVQLFAGGEEVAQDVEEDTGRKSRRQARFAEYGDDDVDEEMPEDEGFVSGDNDSGAEVEQDFDEAKLGNMFRPSKDANGSNGDVAFADSDSDIGEISADEDFEGEDVENDDDLESDEEAAAVRWKDGMAERAGSQLAARAYRAADLARFLYDQTLSLSEAIKKWRGQPIAEIAEDENEDAMGDEDDQFFRKTKGKDEEVQDDRVLPVYDYDALANKWSEAGNVEVLRRRFATSRLLEDGDEADEDGDGFGDEEEMADDDEGDGAFEDLETGEKHGPELSLEEERARNAQRKEELKLRFEEEDKEGFMNDKANAKAEAAPDEQFGEDEWYDAQKALIQKQLDINKSEYEELDERQRAAMEGFRAGKYAKIILEGVPAEFFTRFDPHTPLIVGGLSATEDRFGFVQVRIKRHRWHKKILKTNDPLIFSLGWRRFQALPTYSISDSRTRNRLLKYTPEHMHCFATFYGPLSAPNTSFACFQSFSSTNPGFRIAATGTVLSVDETTDIVKKLKLTGTPAKIFKNSAFISGMFNSALEIAKFEGAAVRTVSGVRGQIKRALAKPEGHFRATFEDKILSSDIVFLRAWYPVKPRVFYNPATNLIGWKPMRLTGEVRRDEGIPTPQDKNSQYRKIERPVRHFNSLKVPRALAADLPFRSQIVQTKKQGKQTYMQKRAVVLGGEERRARDLIVKLNTLRKDAAEKRRAKKEEGRKEYRKKVAELEERRERREKRERDQFWEREGRKRKNSEGGGGGKKRR
jgi:ribosome biogenesis protein BMS1